LRQQLRCLTLSEVILYAEMKKEAGSLFSKPEKLNFSGHAIGHVL